MLLSPSLRPGVVWKRCAALPPQVRLIEHRRAHNILIELSGIRKPFDEIKVGVNQGSVGGAGWAQGGWRSASICTVPSNCCPKTAQ